MRSSDCARDEPESDRVRDDVDVNVERDDVVDREMVEPEEVVVSEVETYVAELWSVASSSWAETVETEIQAQVVDTVALESSFTRVENVVTVTSNQIENVEVVLSNRAAESVPSSDVESVPFDRSPTRFESIEPEPSDLFATRVGNIETRVTNRSPTRFEKVKNYVMESPVTWIENIESLVSSQSSTQIERMKSVAMDSSPTTVGDIEARVSTQPARDENVKTAASYKSLTQVENVESDPSSTRAEDMRTAASDPEQLTVSCEPPSEMYYTASSEASLLSDLELPDRFPQEESLDVRELSRDDRDGVMAGHVAAMRERFENMTRTNTPCPDFMRSVSPSLDVYRNITPSPDHLG